MVSVGWNSLKWNIGGKIVQWKEWLICRMISGEITAPFLFPWSLNMDNSGSIICKELSQAKCSCEQPEWLWGVRARALAVTLHQQCLSWGCLDPQVSSSSHLPLSGHGAVSLLSPSQPSPEAEHSSEKGMHHQASEDAALWVSSRIWRGRGWLQWVFFFTKNSGLEAGGGCLFLSRSPSGCAHLCPRHSHLCPPWGGLPPP